MENHSVAGRVINGSQTDQPICSDVWMLENGGLECEIYNVGLLMLLEYGIIEVGVMHDKPIPVCMGLTVLQSGLPTE